MDKNELTLKVALELDEKWASNFSREELLEYIKERLNYSLGFRGEVKKLREIATRENKRRQSSV